MRYIDLHTHTRYSDGTDEPQSVVRASKMKGIEVMALIDHDHLQAYFDAKDEASLWKMELIPGVEVTTTNYHILGLGVDPENKEFLSFLKEARGYQRNECEERIKPIANYGVPIDMGKVDGLFGDVRLGRHHLLLAMILDEECNKYLAKKHGDVDKDLVYSFYMGKNGIANEASFSSPVTSERAINEIHKAGGIASIAHPFKDVEDMREMDILIEQGLDAIEIQPNFGMENEPFKMYGLRQGIPFTYGSDFHGPGKPRPLLGRGENRIDLEDLFFNKRRRAA